MKVKDLILRLQECKPEAMVVLDGYEGGLCELKNIKDEVQITLDVNMASWYGPHEADTEGTMTAVYLPRS